MSHTPGPWVADRHPVYEGLFRIYGPGQKNKRQEIARCSLAIAEPETFEPNAHLIAAAPDLLTALGELDGQADAVRHMECDTIEEYAQATERLGTAMLATISAAIAKAKGAK